MDRPFPGGRRHQARPPTLWGARTGLGALILALVFVPLTAFGASNSAPALLTAAAAALLAAVCLLGGSPDFIRRLGQVLIWPGALFLALCLYIAWTLSSWSAPWRFADWSWAPAAGSASLVPFATRVELLKLFGLASCFIVGMWLNSLAPLRKAAPAILVVLALAYTIFSTVAFLVSPDHVLGMLKTVHRTRFTATLLDANSAGALFGVFAVLTLAAAPRPLPHGRRSTRHMLRRMAVRTAYAVVPLAVFWAALLGTRSRGALAATSMASLGVLAVRLGAASILQRITLKPPARLATCIALAVLAPLVLAALAFLITGQGWVATDEADRHAMYDKLLVLGAARPWLGWGLGGLSVLNDHVPQTSPTLKVWSFAAAHDLYLQWWVETGLVGAFAAFLTVTCLVMNVADYAITADDRLSLGVAGASLVLIQHNALDFSVQVYGIAALWALLLGLGRAPGRDVQSE